MARELNTRIYKGVFQVSFEPDMEFYSRIHNASKLSTYFEDWETDRLSIQLKDYKKNHSLAVRFNSLTYETDNFNKTDTAKVVEELHKSIPEIYVSEVTRIGFRLFLLIDANPILFDELVQILNVKLFSGEFINQIGTPSDNTATVILDLGNDLSCRFTIGPMTKLEVPNFIQMNAKLHFYKSEGNRLLEISRILESYPEVSLFLDIDIYSSNAKSIQEFYNNAFDNYEKLVKSIKDYVFKKTI